MQTRRERIGIGLVSLNIALNVFGLLVGVLSVWGYARAAVVCYLSAAVWLGLPLFLLTLCLLPPGTFGNAPIRWQSLFVRLILLNLGLVALFWLLVPGLLELRRLFA
jgi:hypothetical protein